MIIVMVDAAVKFPRLLSRAATEFTAFGIKGQVSCDPTGTES